MRIAIPVALLAIVLAAVIAAAAEKAPVGKAPAAKASTAAAVSLEPGKSVPDFTLKDSSGKSYNLAQLTKDGNVVVLEWFNYGCPFVKKYRSPSTFMTDTQAAFAGKKVVWLAICSSAVGKEGGDTAAAAEFASASGMTAPILWDQDGKVGKAFGAVTTPHMFVIGKDRKLFYVGAPDTSTAMDREPKGDNLIIPAVNAALQNKMPAVTQTTPHGCSVKYA